MSKLLDIETILTENEEWSKLDHEWGTPIDLDTEDPASEKLKTAFSSLDLRKTTFDSSFLFKKVRRKVGRSSSKKSTNSFLDYKDFIQDLNQDKFEKPTKQFYFVNGELLSAVSVEDICDEIDDLFKSVEKLCSATSTVRKKEVLRPKVVKVPQIPEIVQCSISPSGLSFDDTEDLEKEKADYDDVDRFIDEVFDQLNSTIATISKDNVMDQSARNTVTAMVNKFSNFLKNPVMKCSPRKRRQCCERFQELAEFWKTKEIVDIK